MDEQSVEVEPAGAADDQASCSIEDQEPPLELSVPDRTDFPVGINDSFSIHLENRKEAAGIASLIAHVSSEQQSVGVSIGDVLVEASATAELDIPVSALLLGDQPLEFSGTIMVSAQVSYEDGVETGVESLLLFFHPESGGWRVYDRLARDWQYHEGALTADARALREEALSAPQPPGLAGSVLAFGGAAHGSKLSDDPEFVPTPSEDN